ncbi:MAG: hypothetical protein AVDCRST_MAG65-595, partial [uncultured Solirubrobacteraceae bacterium]
ARRRLRTPCAPQCPGSLRLSAVPHGQPPPRRGAGGRHAGARLPGAIALRPATRLGEDLADHHRAQSLARRDAARALGARRARAAGRRPRRGYRRHGLRRGPARSARRPGRSARRRARSRLALLRRRSHRQADRPGPRHPSDHRAGPALPGPAAPARAPGGM